MNESSDQQPKSNIERYLKASESLNTNSAYAFGIEHFEHTWHGLLPATSTSVAEYLAAFAGKLSNNTLRQRTAALARWHKDRGFDDPTKADVVRQVLKGARALHPSVEKRARPLELEALEKVDNAISSQIGSARALGQHQKLLQFTRDRAIVRIGFWRGFRSEDLVDMKAEDVDAVEDEGMTIHLNRGKTDVHNEGRDVSCPALSRLCPVSAYVEWTRLAKIDKGPVFRAVHVTGKLSDRPLHIDSVNRILKSFLQRTGLDNSEQYTSHSLRRGFAGWARGSGWTLEQLMDYVGWKDVKSALRYLEQPPAGLKERFERGLPVAQQQVPTSVPHVVAHPVAPELVALIRVKMLLTRFTSVSRGLKRARTLIEQTCFSRFSMKPLDKEGVRYELSVPNANAEALDDTMYALLDDMFAIADANQCALEVDFHEPATGKRWS